MTGARVAVVGAGWAGLTAAVRLVQAGHQTTIVEMAPAPGGRARSMAGTEPMLDNGQHILIGAYRRTLAIMQTVGASTESVLLRLPLTLRYPDGSGLTLPPGPAWAAFLIAVARCNGWSWSDRLSLLGHALRWLAARFKCAPELTVQRLCAGLSIRVRAMLIDPLCVAALNTPAQSASAQVFLRVLRDALFGARGSADLMLPCQPLQALLPGPATAWLQSHGAVFRLGQQVQSLSASGAGWALDGEPFNAVILACSAAEAARLAAGIAPAWSAQAAALRYEPIVTVYLSCPGARLSTPMVALADGPNAPAQFIFDQGVLLGASGRFACVVSGAQRWVDAGLPVTADAVLKQVWAAFPAGTWPHRPTLLRTVAEKRATFACTPQLRRPAARLAPGLFAAGDYVQGPYPATLEGAVQAGEYAASLVLAAG